MLRVCVRAMCDQILVQLLKYNGSVCFIGKHTLHRFIEGL